MAKGVANTEKARLNKSGALQKNPNKGKAIREKNADPEFKEKTQKAMHTPEAEAKKSIKQTAHQAITRVRPETDGYLREAWFDPAEDGISNAHRFIDLMVKQAITDPDSYAARYFLDKMVGDDVLNRLDKTLEEEQNKNLDFQIYRIRQTLFDEQKEVFENVIDKLIMNISGRRWGKSELNQRKLIAGALKHKDAIGIYLNRNFDNALSQGYDTAIKVLDELRIPYTGTRGAGTITFNNGTTIYYRGASNTVDVDKFRGVAKMYMAIIDEACHLKGLKYLLTEVLQPATIDIADSQIILTGTPPRSKNFAYNLWFNKDAKIKRYNFNFMGNPFIPNKETVIPTAAQLNGVSEDSAFIRREYLGDMNALDDDARIFFNYQYNAYTPEQIKATVWDRLYFGIDWGHEDDAAIVAFAADKQRKQLVQLEEWHAPHKATTEIINEFRRIYEKWTQTLKCAKQPYIICDTNEKDNVLDLQVTHKFKNVMCAYKYNKNVGLKQLSSLMNTGNVLVNKDSYIDDEAQNMLWKRDEESDKIIEEVDDAAYHANGMFALLYISRQYSLEVMGYVDANGPAKAIVGGN